MNISFFFLSKREAFRLSSSLTWREHSEEAADTCCKEATEERTRDSTS